MSINKTAIITGASGGIGYATVKKFYDEGYRVAAMDILPLEKVEAKFRDMSDRVIYIEADLSKKEDRERTLRTATEKIGNIYTLVNVAGVAPTVRADILEMSEESYDRVMNINTKGTMFLTQLVANHMIKNATEKNAINGYIVNISSMSAYTSSTSRGEYCISKAGVSMITMLYADRLAEYGILVNEIRPGIIATGMTSTVKEKYDNLIAGGLLPVARWGVPEDIANAVYTLANGSLGYTTRQSIDVDGGYHIHRL